MDGDILLLHLIFMVNIIYACLPKEYKINNTCCPMCDKGFFVKASCTEELSPRIYEICAVRPYGLMECFKCEQCDSGADLVVKQKCTESSNTVCECSNGHFCVSPECDMCEEHKECQPGHYVKKPGTPVTDTECDECPEDHYSDRNNAAQCSPWTKCEELGQILYKEGNSTADSICKEKRSRFLLAVAFAVFPLLAVIIYVLVTCFSIGKQEMTTPDVQDGGGYRDPQQEEHTQSPVSETLLNTSVKYDFIEVFTVGERFSACAV